MKWFVLQIVLCTLLLFGVPGSSATAGGKVGIYGLRMVPQGNDATSYTLPSWGGGLFAIVPVEKLSNLIAGTVGIEFINLITEPIEFQNSSSGATDVQQGDPDCYRFYLGGEVGGHGNGFLRPHAGLDLSLTYYHYPEGVVLYSKQGSGYSEYLTVTVPGKIAFGYDLSLGLDLNFSNTFALDVGVKYLKSFGGAIPVGDGSVTIYPQYFQIYLGLGYSLDLLSGEGGDNDN